MEQTARTVLVVDDDPQILTLVQKMLRPKTFRILVAPRPRQALDLCANEPVHLLISDISMPEMSGEKLAEEVLKLRPETSVLLISGQGRGEPASARAGRVKFLRKPFFPSDLLEKLREMLPEL